MPPCTAAPARQCRDRRRHHPGIHHATHPARGIDDRAAHRRLASQPEPRRPPRATRQPEAATDVTRKGINRGRARKARPSRSPASQRPDRQARTRHRHDRAETRRPAADATPGPPDYAATEPSRSPVPAASDQVSGPDPAHRDRDARRDQHEQREGEKVRRSSSHLNSHHQGAALARYRSPRRPQHQQGNGPRRGWASRACRPTRTTNPTTAAVRTIDTSIKHERPGETFDTRRGRLRHCWVAHTSVLMRASRAAPPRSRAARCICRARIRRIWPPSRHKPLIYGYSSSFFVLATYGSCALASASSRPGNRINATGSTSRWTMDE